MVILGGGAVSFERGTPVCLFGTSVSGLWHTRNLRASTVDPETAPGNGSWCLPIGALGLSRLGAWLNPEHGGM
jgi:hypothetical protein